MGENVVAALVAAGVSVAVALATTYVALRGERQARLSHEQQLKRDMTQLLYERRLAVYPRAISITEALRSGAVEDSRGDPHYFRRVLEQLDAWNSGEAAFLLSMTSLDQIYRLRRAIRAASTDPGECLSDSQLDEIWDTGKALRASLRQDMALLYQEEERKGDQPPFRWRSRPRPRPPARVASRHDANPETEATD